MPLQDPLAKYETQLTGFRANFLGSGDSGGGFGGGDVSVTPPQPIQIGFNPIPGSPDNPVSSTAGKAADAVTGAGNAVGGAISGTLFGLALKRIAIFFIGLICIIGAIYLFKSTSFIVKNAVGAATKAGAAAIAP